MVNSSYANVWLLALCQALSMTSITILFTTAALVGQAIAIDESLATVPLAISQLAVLIGTIPASLLMQRIGRQLGFLLGVLIGLAGAGLSLYAILTEHFLLFCLATFCFGLFNSFASFYRFAAAEAAPEPFRSQAISWVIAGGVVAGLAGPPLANSSKDWLPSAPFAGGFIVIAALQLISVLLLLRITLPRPTLADSYAEGRSLLAIMRQPIFITAATGSMMGYGIMAMIMTATPLAMAATHHPFHQTAMVMQWHVLGMFAPSFFTGMLIARFGVLMITGLGALLCLICVGINVLSVNLWSFSIALLLLGIGWNFLFIGSTSLLTHAYKPSEKAKTQAMHDFLMYAFVATATMSSGSLFEWGGWQLVNYVGLPMLVLVFATSLWLVIRREVPRSI